MGWNIFVLCICVLILIKLLFIVTSGKCRSKVYLGDKTALITGGNSGIGLQLVKELASRGCTVIIADKTDASNTVRNVIKETRNPRISFKIVDLASFASVRRFAEEVKDDVNKLDILVNNAGTGDYTKFTEDGIQEIMQVNYFSHFLLTHLLLDLLLKPDSSRIINASSIVAYSATLSEINFKSENVGKAILSFGAYGHSKLALAMMSRVLAKKLKTTGVTSNAYHPGSFNSGIWNSLSLTKSYEQIGPFIGWIYTLIFGKNSDEIIQTPLHLACSDQIEKTTGEFFMECNAVWQPRQIYDTTACEKIWAISEECVKLKPNEKIERIIEKSKL